MWFASLTTFIFIIHMLQKIHNRNLHAITGVTGKPISPTKVYPCRGYVLEYVSQQNYTQGRVWHKESKTMYSLVTIYVCQTIAKVQFGYDLHMPKDILGNFRYWVWFSCYTGSKKMLESISGHTEKGIE